MDTLLVLSNNPSVIQAIRLSFQECVRIFVIFTRIEDEVTSAPLRGLSGVIFDESLFTSEESLRKSIQTFRNRHPAAFFMFLSDGAGVPSEIAALQSGVDFCLRRPLDENLFSAQLQAFGRRVCGTDLSMQRSARVRNVEGLEIDLGSYAVSYCGQHIQFTRAEFLLLEALTRAPGKVVSHDDLGNILWGWDSDNYLQHIKIHLSRIRSKLALAHCEMKILSARGIGYSVSFPRERSTLPNVNAA